MTHTRMLATLLLLALVAFGCGKKAEQPPLATQPASPMPGAMATEAPITASAPAAPTTTPPRPASTAAPKALVTTQTTQPEATPSPAATSAPPPTTQMDEPTTPARAAQRPQGRITLPAKLGAVTFDHESHAGKRDIACTACHHPSRPQKPLTSENQACRGCHTMPAAAPMTTSLQAAFHDPRGAGGTCIDCHKQKGGSAPVKCLGCHKK